ncbi:chymotrypsin-1 [Trichogramma pretiosum]|uniref:chymotrypsin-1 n=1 Tax=Trichogramma pretiosum TaxID=7493 RepID=UPI0006C93F1A|nr:chymotrypsin-1 [Trichogramma pretiosum]
MLKFWFIFGAIIFTCIDAKSRSRGRMLHGVDAEKDEFPYMAFIKHRKYNEFICGASIIGKRLILTAAHCVDGRKSFQVVVGTHNRQDGTAVAHKVKKIFVHGDYKSSSGNFIENNNVFEKDEKLESDIAILLLKDDVIFNDKVQPIRLAPADYKVKNVTEAVISGWGYYSKREKLAKTLQKLKVTMVHHDICKRQWEKILPSTIDEGMICTSSINSDYLEGICNGDSGGPLVTDDGYQVGVAIISYKCGYSYVLPDVYTSVMYYAHWINRILNKYS